LEVSDRAGLVEIADDVEIRGEHNHRSRVAGRHADSRGSENWITWVHVGHNVQIGPHTVIAAQTGISGSSKLVASRGGRRTGGGSRTIARWEMVRLRGRRRVFRRKIIRKGQYGVGTPARPLEQFRTRIIGLRGCRSWRID